MMTLRLLGQVVALLAIPQDGVSIENKPLAANVQPFEPGPPHAGPHHLDDQVAFDLCDRTDDDDDGAAHRATCLDRLSEPDELDLQVS